MSKAEQSKSTIEGESYIVDSSEKLWSQVARLEQAGRVRAIGFDVFGTLLTSLYTRDEQTIFLSEHVAKYLNVIQQECAEVYKKTRERVKSTLRKTEDEILNKEVECPEERVISEVGRFYEAENITGLIHFVQSEWLKYDLENAIVILGMKEVVKNCVSLFGQNRVATYTNNSCTNKHVVDLLRKNKIIGDHILNSNNTFVSSETGLRKPNTIMFKNLSAHMSVDPKEMAFAGDGKNDVLFATNSGGVGIRIQIPR